VVVDRGVDYCYKHPNLFIDEIKERR
jgi:hypothetical protein